MTISVCIYTVYDYAASGYGQYIASMTNVRNSVNAENNSVMDEMDNAFFNGNLMSGGLGVEIQRDGDTMDFIFNIKGDEGNWNPGTMFYYNGAINAIQGIHNPEELKYLQSTYQECTGRELKAYGWTNLAPVYVRLFGTLQPGASNSEIASAIKKLTDQLNSEI